MTWLRLNLIIWMWTFCPQHCTLCALSPHISVYICTLLNFASFISRMCSSTVRSYRKLIVQCIFPLLPFSVFFRLAMECMMWGLRGPTMWNIMTELLPGMAPFSLNLILAVLKIVCILGCTDRLLFSESLLRPGCWKRPLCASRRPQRPFEIFTGQHLVWNQRRRRVTRDTTQPGARAQLALCVAK